MARAKPRLRPSDSLRESIARIRLVFQLGVHAAPRWALAHVALQVSSGVIPVVTAFAIGGLVDTIVDAAGVRIALVAGAISLLVGFEWLTEVMVARVSMHVVEHGRPLIEGRIASVVSEAPGIAHLEQPRFLDELSVLHRARGWLIHGLRLASANLQLVVQLAGSTILLASIEPLLGLFPFAGAVPVLLAGSQVGFWGRTETEIAESGRVGNALFQLSTNPISVKELMNFRLFKEFQERHWQVGQSIESVVFGRARSLAAQQVFGWLVFGAAFSAGLLFMARSVVNGQATAGDVVMMVGLGLQIGGQIGGIRETVAGFGEALRAAGRLRWLESEVKGLTQPQGGTKDFRSAREIQLTDVRFRYADTDREALSGVSISIPFGSIVGLVGENGAGKSTLVKLLCRFYDPTGGRILVDGVDISEFDLISWRVGVAGTFQDFVRYELIAREVVGVGDLRLVDQDAPVLRAIRCGGADALLETLDGGLETPLGHLSWEGRQLSEGEWQKLALARGMMRDRARVVLLDEPTAGLDPISEADLFESLRQSSKELRPDAITILISHRFSTLRHADVILVLKDGALLQAGSHAELLAEKGLYAELFELQSRRYR